MNKSQELIKLVESGQSILIKIKDTSHVNQVYNLLQKNKVISSKMQGTDTMSVTSDTIDLDKLESYIKSFLNNIHMYPNSHYKLIRK